MYKMKDVCQMTGLTEKAIRLYMEQKLVEPKVEEGVHRKAYYFDEKDIERLKDVATLRNAGFSIADIKLMIENPSNISALVEEKEVLLALEISQMKSLQQTLTHLTIQEHSDVTKLADAIEPRSTYAKETPKKKMSRGKRWTVILIIISLLLMLLILTSGVIVLKVFGLAFGGSFGILATVSGIRYLLYIGRARKRECRGTGKVVAVVTNEKIEEYIEEPEYGMAKDFAMLLLFGIAGMGIWESLRLDCWYPVIQYKSDGGNIHTATFRHGGFKNSWKIGDELEIAWDRGREKLVYACKGREIRKKALAYLIPGIIMLIISMTLLFVHLDYIYK